MLIKTDFGEDKINSTISILNELKTFMKSSNNIIDLNFPSQWFIHSLLDYLKIIPKNLVEDNCNPLVRCYRCMNNAFLSQVFIDGKIAAFMQGFICNNSMREIFIYNLYKR